MKKIRQAIRQWLGIPSTEGQVWRLIREQSRLVTHINQHIAHVNREFEIGAKYVNENHRDIGRLTQRVYELEEAANKKPVVKKAKKK